jgi:hypothetical protein
MLFSNHVKLKLGICASMPDGPANATTGTITTTTLDEELLAQKMGKALNSIAMNYRRCHGGGKKNSESEPQSNMENHANTALH